MKKNLISESKDDYTESIIAKNKSEFNYSKNKSIMKMQKFFKIDSLGSTIKKEIVGGVATFLAMVYILSVNSDLISGAESIDGLTKMDPKGVFLATTISCFVCTLIMGLFANMPAGMAPSMGMNAMFTFTVANGSKLGYEGALICVIFSSILFLLFSITPLRTKILIAIPDGLVKAFGVSIAFFIAYIGLKEMGWFTLSGGLPVASLSNLKVYYPYIIIGMITLVLMLVLYYKKVPGATIIAIIIGFLLSIAIANIINIFDSNNWIITTKTGVNNQTEAGQLSRSVFKNFDWSYNFSGFTGNIKSTFKEFANTKIYTNPAFYISIFVFIFLNFFDATGALTAFNIQLDSKTHQHKEIKKSTLVVDSASTIIGGVLGTSPMTTFLESSTGIEQGARTGFASVITSVGFLLAIPLEPIFAAIPQCVTAAACVFVGTLMIANISKIDWKRPEIATSAFFAIIFMLTTYSITNGVAISIISYTIMMLIFKKAKEVNWVLYILSFVFIAYLIAFAFLN